MTPIERLALSLAYQWARRSLVGSVVGRVTDHRERDERKFELAVELTNSAEMVNAFVRSAYNLTHAEHRKRMARRCLALRAVLRADAGDFGRRYECSACGAGREERITEWPRGCAGRPSRSWPGRHLEACQYDTVSVSSTVRPLWEHAPKTRVR